MPHPSAVDVPSMTAPNTIPVQPISHQPTVFLAAGASSDTVAALVEDSRTARAAPPWREQRALSDDDGTVPVPERSNQYGGVLEDCN